jgi:hypothetical protein
MNTAFGGNRVHGVVTFDTTNSYPVGLLSGLGPIYNDQQLLTLAQLRYTDIQSDISAESSANYASLNLSLLNAQLTPPGSAISQITAVNYTNAASQINYANQIAFNLANVEYTNAKAVAKACTDAAYSGFLTTEAYALQLETRSTLSTVSMKGNLIPDINLLDTVRLSSISSTVATTVQLALTTYNNASTNTALYISNTSSLIGAAIIKSASVTANLTLQKCFTTVAKLVIKTVTDVLSKIAGKESLISQYGTGHVPLQNAINIASYVLTCINTFITQVSAPSTTNYSTPIINLSTFTNTLHSIARANNESNYFSEFMANSQIGVASTLRGYNSPISVPDIYITSPQGYNSPIAVPNTYSATPLYALTEFVSSSASLLNISNDADISAYNSQGLTNAVMDLKNAIQNTPTPELATLVIANNASTTITYVLNQVQIVTSNSSAFDSVSVIYRCNNILTRKLEDYTISENNLISSISNASTVLTLLSTANAISSNVSSVKTKSWAINAANDKANSISDTLRSSIILLNTTANTLITPQKLAIQTAAAYTAGATIAYKNSRLARLSNNTTALENPPNNSFKSIAPVPIVPPTTPNIDDLLARTAISPYNINSLPSIRLMQKRAQQNGQIVFDKSAFSFRQQ